jgi:hypothetical protein
MSAVLGRNIEGTACAIPLRTSTNVAVILFVNLSTTAFVTFASASTGVAAFFSAAGGSDAPVGSPVGLSG